MAHQRGRPKTDPSKLRGSLLDHSTRRSIARACRCQPRSVAQLEKALRRKGLNSMVANMEAWGILEEVGKTPRGGAIYALDAGWAAELKKAIKRNASAATVDQSFMVLSQPELSSAAQCLARKCSDDLDWVGVLGKREGLLIRVDGGSSALARIEEALRESGIECELRPIEESASGLEAAPFLRGFGAEGP